MAALLGKSVSSSSSSFYLIMTNDAKHMCQGNEMNVSVGKFKSFFFLLSEKKGLVFVRKEKTKRDQRGGFFVLVATTMAIRFESRQEEVEKKSLNFLLLSFCVHIQQGEEKDEWLLVENRGC